MSDKAILQKGHTDASHQPVPGQDQTPPGVRAIQKIRLLHALIRWLIKFDPKGAGSVFDGPLGAHPFLGMLKMDWPVKEKGEPISQAFLAGTLLTFSLTVIEAMRRMLVPVSPPEAHAYLHRWKVIGFKLGVDDDMLEYFDSLDSARHLHAAMMAEFRGATEQGGQMAFTLEQYMVRNIVDRVPLHWLFGLRHMPRVAMWHLAGRDTCEALDMKPGLFGRTFGWLVWQVLRLIGFLKRLPIARRLSNWIFEWLTRVMWGWRRQDDPLPAPSATPPGEGDGADQQPAAAPRGVVVSRELADRWGVPKRKSPVSPAGR